jgi:hypothetical protein
MWLCPACRLLQAEERCRECDAATLSPSEALQAYGRFRSRALRWFQGTDREYISLVQGGLLLAIPFASALSPWVSIGCVAAIGLVTGAFHALHGSRVDPARGMIDRMPRRLERVAGGIDRVRGVASPIVGTVLSPVTDRPLLAYALEWGDHDAPSLRRAVSLEFEVVAKGRVVRVVGPLRLDADAGPPAIEYPSMVARHSEWAFALELAGAPREWTIAAGDRVEVAGLIREELVPGALRDATQPVLRGTPASPARVRVLS